MPKLKFSVADHFTDSETLFKKIAETGIKERIEPDIQSISWQLMWSYLQRSAFGSDGFDVSEIGSTWVASFSDMGLIAELDHNAIDVLGGEGRFVPSAWNSAGLMKEKERFAVPFLADTRVIYYWRDALDSVGVDEETAFSTPDKMEETISRLSGAGKPTWAAPTFSVTNVVHQIATWMWSGGGDFFSFDGTQTAFCKDEALAGIISYFTLQRYMRRKYDSLDSVLEAFQQGTAAVIMSGPWFYRQLIKRNPTPGALSGLGVALPPGPPFVGGSSLVIWQGEDKTNQKTAVEWIKLLTDVTAQKEVARNTGLLPVVTEAFNTPPYTTDPHYRVFRDALRKGRPMPQVPFWGTLEAELVHTFGSIWSDLKEDPRSTPENAVREHLIPMAQIFDDKLYRHSFPPPTN